MNVFETLPYLVKVNLYWVLFYACYWLLFRKHTFFKWNRFYLITTLLISWALPLIELPAAPSDNPVPTISESAYDSIVASQVIIPQYSTEIVDSRPVVNWSQILLTIYVIGFGLMAVQLLRGLNDLRKVIAINTVIHFEEYSIVFLDSKTDLNQASGFQPGSFSFFKWLFLTKDDYEHHLETILNHELVHIKQRHSWDIVFIELLKTAFWFNPALWFYKNSMQEVHEFLADEDFPNRNAYSNFLVSYALNAPVQSLTNHFFNSRLLKIRIQMIYKHRTSRWLLSKYSVIIPVAILAVFLTAARERADIKDEVVATNVVESGTPETNIPNESSNPAQILPATETTVQPTTINSENVSVKGQILGKNGYEISGAIVIVKNSKIGTATDENGKFELKDIPSNSVLAVSHLLYNSAEIPLVSGKSVYKQVLEKKDVNSLHEVVVVGYVPPINARKNEDIEEVKSNEFVPVESYPEFPGGSAEMYKFIARNVKYPTRASKAHVQGRIIVSFMIDMEGKTSNANIIKGIGFGMDEEVVRVIYNMPKWNPALQNGKPIPMEYTLPVMFSLEEEKTTDKRQGSVANPEKYNLAGINQYQIASLTLLQDNPLVVVNGTELEQRGSAALKEIETKDITSISYLRGATATSLYGSNAASGVVMVKTREATPKTKFMNYRYTPGKILSE